MRGLIVPKGVLDRLAPLAHGLRVLVEPPPHGFVKASARSTEVGRRLMEIPDIM